ncbi:YobA family protein [Bacillus sp. EAC]|uniref:YobA family protein n=1 Tax=Bacillus sp. EAC TaxID=1978338 RepID=UPI0015C4FC6E|nr:YobA family protein [Bacillus sp. EAC]
MKKFKTSALILCSISSAFLLASCSNNTTNHLETKTKVSDEQTSNIVKKPGIEGYVLGIRGHQMLVVSQEPKNYESTSGTKEFYNAVWFSNAPRNIKIGQKVQVWFDYMLESYPGQSNAEKVKVIKSKSFVGSKLTEADVIKKVVHDQSKKIKELMIPSIIIKSIEYDKHFHRFTVQIQDLNGKQKWNYQFEDKQ